MSLASLLGIALMLVLLGFPGQAIAATHQAPTNFLLQAQEAIRSEQYPLAYQVLTQAIQAHDRPAVAYANRCLVAIYLETYQSAIADCTAALQLAPDQTEAYLNRGLAHYRLGNDAAAIADYDRLLQRQPTDLRAYFNRGLAKANSGQHQDAIQDYNLALAQQPDATAQAEILVERGLAFLALQDVPAALDNFSQAIEWDPTSDRAYYNRGCLQGKQSHYLAAIDDFTHALQLNPNNSDAYLDRGIALYHLEDISNALQDLQTAASFFSQQGRAIAYQQARHLIQQIQQVQDWAIA
jgi:tetratricopeptide (TPR) repeat protein